MGGSYDDLYRPVTPLVYGTAVPGSLAVADHCPRDVASHVLSSIEPPTEAHSLVLRQRRHAIGAFNVVDQCLYLVAKLWL
jgi:hypothetical protein